MRWLVVLLAFALPVPGFAEDNALPSYQTDFTFKRVTVGANTSGKRITVQIDPEEQARMLAALPEVTEEEPDLDSVVVADPETAGLPYADFWALLSPEISDSPQGRFVEALGLLGALDEVPGAPRLSTFEAIADAYSVDLLKETIGTRISPALVLSVVAVESSGNPDAESSAGAVGLMQLMPATAERFDVEDRSDPAQSLRGGIAYLDWLVDHFEGDVVLALAAYNAGENAVARHGGVPPYSETRAYVPKVLAAWNVAKTLCLTPPELASDGCVLRSSGG